MSRALRCRGAIAVLAATLAACLACGDDGTGSTAGQVLVSSYRTDSVLRYDARTGAFLGVLVAADAAHNGGLSGPQGLAFGPDGALCVSSYNRDFGFGAVLRYDARTGAFLGALVPDDPALSGGLKGAAGLTFGPDGSLYVSSALTNSVLRYDGRTGAFLGSFAGAGGLDSPSGLTFGPDGNLYVASLNYDITNDIAYPGAVLRYGGATGAYIDAFVPPDSLRNGGLIRTRGLAFGPDDNLYVCSGDVQPRGCVLRYDGHTGAFMDTFTALGQLDEPVGLAFGPDGSLCVATAGGSTPGARGSGSVRRFSASTGAPQGDFVVADAARNGGLTGATYLLYFTPARARTGSVAPLAVAE